MGEDIVWVGWGVAKKRRSTEVQRARGVEEFGFIISRTRGHRAQDNLVSRHRPMYITNRYSHHVTQTIQSEHSIHTT